MTKLGSDDSPPIPEAHGSELLLNALIAALRCSEAIELTDRSRARIHLEELREGIRALQEIEHAFHDEVSRLIRHESNLTRAVLAIPAS
jgi:hypothetical protein